MKKMYRFMWDCGRMGNVEGLFFAEGKDVEEAIGLELYFGEILGKHSEVCGELEADDLKEIDISSDALKEMMDTFEGDTIVGYNPLKHISEEDEED